MDPIRESPTVAAPRNFERIALPTDGHWETGKAGRTRRPVSQDTCRRLCLPAWWRGVSRARISEVVMPEVLVCCS